MKLLPIASLCLAPILLKAEPRQIFPAETEKWQMAGPGEFHIEDDVATAHGGMGLWWFAEKSFQSATLTLEFKLNDPSQNSGVFIRFPDPNNDPWVAVREGYEIQISGREINKNATGSIYDIQAPTAIPLLEDGAWNTMKIHTVTTGDQTIAVELNGKLINLFSPSKGRGDKEGYFGIQNHDAGSPVKFRNITVAEHDASTQLTDLLTPSQLSTYRSARKLQSKEDSEE
jgi:hypothetical protein